MANTINWGKIYEKTAWGIGVVTNTISWGKIYANLAGSIPSFALDFANIANDFTFTRSSFATRVNEQGLIETVTDLGSELVQNGDFEEISSELITNGDFATDSDWSFGSGWSIEDGKAIALNTNGNLEQFVSGVTASKSYIITFDYVYTSGDVVLYAFGNNLGNLTETKSYSFTTTATGSTTRLQFYGVGTNLNATIDNVSVKQVDPNDNWSFGNVGGSFGWNIANGRAICDATGALNGRNLEQTLPTTLIAGKTYRLSLDILQSVDAMQISLGGVVQFSLPIGTNLGYSIDFIPTTTSDALRIFGSTSDLQEIDNVSVQEVLEDDLPRIDYSTGEPAFLLEPQSTNLLPYSEDFSQWVVLGTLTSNSGISPDGTQNADLLESDPTVGRLTYNLTLSASTDYIISMYIKIDSVIGLATKFRVYEFDSNTMLTSTPIGSQLVVGEWVRIEVPFTTNLGGNTAIRLMEDMPIGDSALVWGAQVEELPYATSYIPTNGSVVTRSAETCVDATPTINSEEGVLYAEISALADSVGTRLFSLNDGSTSNIIQIYYSNTSNRITTELKVSGSAQFAFNYTLSDVTDINKIAFKYKENDFALWVNGVEVYTDTLGTTFTEGTLSELDFDIGSGSFPFYGRTKDLRIYTEALTDDELITLTTI